MGTPSIEESAESTTVDVMMDVRNSVVWTAPLETVDKAGPPMRDGLSLNMDDKADATMPLDAVGSLKLPVWEDI